MKFKRLILSILVLLLLMSLIPAAVSAAGAKFPSLDLSTAEPRSYDVPYTEQFDTTKTPHLITFTVPENGIVTFAFDIGERVPGTKWNLNFDLYTAEDFPYPFWESETRSGLPVEGIQTLSFGLAPGTYYAVTYYDYIANDFCVSGETHDVTYALSFAPSDYCELENKPITITPGYGYAGFCGNRDTDVWDFTISNTYVAQIYIANMDAIWEGNDPSIEIFYLRHKEDHRVYYLDPKDAYADANGDKYFLYQFIPGNYSLEIRDQSRKQTPYAVAIVPIVYIDKQPASVKVAMGKTAKVSVSAMGEGLKYQWYYKNKGSSSFKKYAAGTSATYTTTMSTGADGRQLYCVVTDKYGNTEKTKTVTISLNFGITKQPVSTTVIKNKTAKISVSAVGEGLKYQWYYKTKSGKSFKKLSSAKSSSYSLKMTSSNTGQQMYCVVTDKYGNTVKSSTVTLKVAPTLKITKQPTTTVKAVAGKKVSATVKASGDGLKYQWYYKNKGTSSFKKYAAGTTATYSTTMSASSHGRQVYCVVTDKYGQTVKSKTTTFYANTSITKHPASVRVAKGQKATVSVNAVGEKLTYAWYYKDPGAKSFKKASTKTNTYSCTMSAAVNGRQVYCVIKGKYGGSVKTKTVTLSLGTPVSITNQPVSQLAFSGTTAKVTVAAKGDGLTYKWYTKNKSANKFSYVSSVTGATYSVKMTDTVSGCQIYCVVTDKYGNKAQTKTVTLSLPTAEQYCGENIIWYIDENGTMTLTGSGAMYDYAQPWDRPYDDLIHTVKKIVVGDGITDLGTNAFDNFDEATSVSLPNTLKTIGRSAFSSCGFSDISIPDSVTEIKQWAFQFCIGLKSFTIPAGVEKIGELVFDGCGYIESFIVDSDNLHFSTDSYGVLFNKDKTILHYMPPQHRGYYLMPNTVTDILNGTITDARFLTAIVYRGTRKQWQQHNLGSYTGVDIYYAVADGVCGKNLTWSMDAAGKLTISGTGPMDEYLNAEKTWRNFSLAITSIVIKPGVTSIGNNAFSGASNLTSVSIPSTVKTIGHEAFFHCSLLKSVVIPNGVSTLKRYTFGDCPSLTSVYIPASVKTIEVGAFSSCTKLKTINYGGSSSNWKKISIKSNFNEALKTATKKYNVSQPS